MIFNAIGVHMVLNVFTVQHIFAQLLVRIVIENKQNSVNADINCKYWSKSSRVLQYRAEYK